MAVFVGRTSELRELERGLRDAAAGFGSVMLVAGEPGIGKTALVQQLEPLARLHGMRMVWGRCWPEAAPALWPWREVVAGLGEGELADAMGLPTGGGPDARFRRFEAVARAVSRTSGVVVLDDLQWADPDTVDLLRFVGRRARQLPVLLIGTYRDTEPAAAPQLASLLADVPALGQVLRLTGLSAGEMTEMAAALQPRGDPSQLHRRSGGNPFFARALLADPVATGGGVQAAIRRRLDRLGREVAELVQVASVLGRDIAVLDVAAVADRGLLDAADALELAIEGGVLRRGAGDRLEFVHDIVREVAAASAAPAQLAHIHWRAGSHLLNTAPDELGRAAHHLRRGVAAGDRTLAGEASLAAGRRAAELLAFHEAVVHLRAAVDLLPGRIDARLALGDALLRSGRWEEAADAHGTAFAQGLAAGSPEDVARAALGIGAGLSGFEVRGFDSRQIELLERAEQELRGSGNPLAAIVVARLAVARSLLGDPGERLALTLKAVEMADASGDPTARAYARAAHCDSIAGPDHVEDRRRLAREIAELAAASGNEELRLLGHRFEIVAALEAGDLVAADRAIGAFTEGAERYRLPLVLWYVPLFAGMRALLRGDTAAAEAAAGRARDIGQEAGSANARMLSDSLLMAVRRQRGTLHELAPELHEILRPYLQRSPTLVGPWSCAAVLAVDCGELDRARWVLDVLLAVDFRSDDRDSEWLGSLSFCAEAAVATGNLEAAARLRLLLEPYGDLWIVDGIGAACLGWVGEHLGRLSAVLGDSSAAQRWFAEAEGEYRRVGAPLLLERVLAQRPTGAVAAAPIARGSFRRDGDVWVLGWGSAEIRLRDAKGLHDIATLLDRPGQELHVAQLTGAVVGAGLPVLDDQARIAYGRRLAELEAEAEQATADADPWRAERARDEREALVQALAQAAGLGGRSRRTGDGVERARQAVRARIRHSLDRIEQQHPELGRHLRRSIRTGTWCCYEPEVPVRWDVGELTV